MSASRVTFSIITAVKNGETTIGDCLNSVRNQGEFVEHIVVDGASTDTTLDIVKRHAVSNSIVVSEPDRGIYDGMNKGLRRASGDVIGFLNGDDFYASRSVLSEVAERFENPDLDSCYGDLIYVSRSDETCVKRFWKAGHYDAQRFFSGWMPPHPTFFARRSAYERFGGFNLKLGTSADYELMLRLLLKHGLTTSYIPRVLVVMRMGGASNASIVNRLKANRLDRMAWAANDLRPKPWTLIAKPLSKTKQFFLRVPKSSLVALTESFPEITRNPQEPTDLAVVVRRVRKDGAS